MHKNREKNAMRREVNRADIGGKSGNKVKDCHVTIIRSLLSQIKENSLRVLLTYRKLFTINTKIAVEFIINSCIVYYKLLSTYFLILCNKKGCKPYKRLQPQAYHRFT